MKRLIALGLLAVVVVIALLAIVQFTPSSPSEVADSAPLRASLAKTDHLHIHEGLPHQDFEGEIFAKEMKRGDVETIGSYSFYTPAVSLSEPEALINLLQSADTLAKKEKGVRKACGRFHPDYAISWTVEGVTREALICFGCEEILFTEERESFHYDLTPNKVEQFENLLSPYALKRPNKK